MDHDSIRIVQTIRAMICDIDLQEFDAAQRLFSDRVHVDYTSLWGGEAAIMTSAELIRGWMGIVPGFDATWHEIGDIETNVEGTRANARCSVAARHWLEGALWLPRGLYEFELERRGAWRITLMRLVLNGEEGDRALVARARARAAILHQED